VPQSSEWPSLVAADDDLVTFAVGDEITAESPFLPIRVDRHEIRATDAAVAAQMRTPNPEVLAIQADVTDAQQMEKVVALAHERFGAINGVIHAAGVLASGTLALRPADAAAPGLAAKVHGTRVLERVLRDEPLDFLLLCSSVSSLLGGVGDSEYAAANAFLDAFAHERTGRGYPVVSVNWDRWRGFGMAAVPEARYLSRTGHPMAGGIDPEEALACFAAIVGAPRVPQVIVAPSGFDKTHLNAARADITLLVSRMVSAARHPRPFMATPFVVPRGNVEEQIAAVWQEALGIDTIGANDDFSELGGDSLIAVKVASRLREALGLALGIAALFEAPTVASLATHVEALRWAATAGSSAAFTEDLDEGEL
jgi:acyl carrier protein